jgi:phospholipid/cholesterol/gamma-HCH transport system substrate-binding protein
MSRVASPAKGPVMSRRRVVDLLVGCCYFLLVAAFLAGAMLVYNKAFVDRTGITLTTGTLGNAIQKGSDVKLNGVPVGTVTTISPTASGARLTLELEPAVAKTLPASTTARLLPKTLFGERYVSLLPGSGGSASGGISTVSSDRGGTLASGGEIHQDTSQEAVELQELFDQMLPLLQSIQPEKLSATLGELAAALRGQGGDIGESMAAWSSYLKKLNPLVPQMADDFGKLGTVAQQYADAVPDLLDALDTMTTTSATMVAERDQLRQVFATVVDAADSSTGWVQANDKTIRVLSKDSRKALKAVVPYATEFPCLFKAMNQFIPTMDKTLGKGTDEPGMHLVLNVVPSRGKYLAGKDAPVYATNGGPRCPYVTGQTGTQPVARAPRGTQAGPAGADTAGRTEDPPAIPAPPASRLAQVDTDLGEQNSPGENQLIAELVAPTQGLAPSEYPDWASLLLGPTLRGAQVSIR